MISTREIRYCLPKSTIIHGSKDRVTRHTLLLGQFALLPSTAFCSELLGRTEFGAVYTRLCIATLMASVATNRFHGNDFKVFNKMLMHKKPCYIKLELTSDRLRAFVLSISYVRSFVRFRYGWLCAIVAFIAPCTL